MTKMAEVQLLQQGEELMLQQQEEKQKQKQKQEEKQIVQEVRSAIRRAQVIAFWKSSRCLVNALTAQRMLEVRGISSALHLGVAKTENRLSAHAWLMHGDTEIVGGRERSGFTPLGALQGGASKK